MRRRDDDRIGYHSDDSRYSDYHYPRDRRDDRPRDKKRFDSLDKYVEDEIAHYISKEREREERDRARERKRMEEEE